MAGQMVHAEIPAGDTAKAREFWLSLFGWQFQAFEGSPSEYLMTRLSETSGGAIFQAEARNGAPASTSTSTTSTPGAARVKEALGGESDDPMPVPGMGWFATCKDNEGNKFGLWQ